MCENNKKTLTGKDVFIAEKELFEITQEVKYTELEKSQQKEFKENLNPKNYKKYVFDVDLSKDIVSCYNIEQKLYHPTDIYVTSCITKPLKNTRYLIYSKEFEEIPDEELLPIYQNKKIATSGIMNCFKIIDITTINDKTQIALLHYVSFEEIAIDHHKTEIEEKIKKESKNIFEESFNKKSLKIDEKLNYKIETGIGINKNKTQLKPFTKDQLIYLLELYGEITEKFNIKKIYELLEKYDITSILNVYQNSVDEIKKMPATENTDFDKEKEKITQACIDSVINTLIISQELESGKYDMDEISKVLNIPKDQLDEMIDLK